MAWTLLGLPLLVWVAATAGARVAVRFGQPAFVGQLAAGIVLGPTGWALLVPGGGAAVGHEPVALAAEVGLVMMVAEAGRAVDARHVSRNLRPVVWIVLLGFVAPFLVGVALAGRVPAALVPDAGRPTAFGVLMGVALAMSALPVLWATVRARGLERWPVVHVMVASVAVGDLLGWLAVAWAASRGEDAALGPLRVLAATVAAGLVAALAARTASWVVRRTPLPGAVAAVATVLGVAETTAVLGGDGVLGALVAGLILSRHRDLALPTTVVDRLAVPFFFAWSAAHVDLAVVATPLVAATSAAIFVVAVAVKLLGSAAGARLGGLSGREALAVGAGLSSRGAVEIAVGLIGIQAGLFGPELFAALVVLAVGTSVLTPVLLRAGAAGQRQAAGRSVVADPPVARTASPSAATAASS